MMGAPWWKFWDPHSGATGGFIMGLVIVACAWLLKQLIVGN